MGHRPQSGCKKKDRAKVGEINTAGSSNGRLLLHRHDQKIEADERQPAYKVSESVAEILKIPAPSLPTGTVTFL